MLNGGPDKSGSPLKMPHTEELKLAASRQVTPLERRCRPDPHTKFYHTVIRIKYPKLSIPFHTGVLGTDLLAGASLHPFAVWSSA